jgi:hypothetical protein
MPKEAAVKYGSFAEFYPFYLSEHENQTCRRLHFAGTTVGLACLIIAVITLSAWFILAGLVIGYAFAWAGHFFFEKNRPATFEYPFYSFAGDWVMWKDMIVGKIEL